MTVKRALVVSLGVFGFMLAAFSVAWACTSQAAIYDVSNTAPVPGETVTVRGLEFHTNTALEVRWGTADGPVIATALTGQEEPDEAATDATRNYGVDRGTFSVAVTIPADAAPGSHQLFAIDPASDWQGGVGFGSVAVVIPGASSNDALAESEVWDEAATEAPTQTPTETEQPAAGESPVSEAPVTAPAAAPVTVAPAPAAESPAAQSPAPVAPAPVATAPVVERAASEPVPAGTAAPETEPEPAFAPATAADWRYSHGALMHTEPASPVAVDMEWRYTHGALMHSAATPDGAADEWVGVPQAAATPDATTGLGAGFGLLAIGLVVLFGGFAVATVARRREEVTVDGR